MLKILSLVLIVNTSYLKKEKNSNEVVVKMKTTVIKDKPNYAAKTITEVKEGHVLKVIEETKNWTKVEFDAGKTGYINSSAYTSKKTYIPSETAQSSKEVRKIQESAAAKGFSKEIEQDYRAKNANLDAQYKLLDEEVISKPRFKRQGSGRVLIEDIVKVIDQFKTEGGIK